MACPYMLRGTSQAGPCRPGELRTLLETPTLSSALTRLGGEEEGGETGQRMSGFKPG